MTKVADEVQRGQKILGNRHVPATEIDKNLLNDLVNALSVENDVANNDEEIEDEMFLDIEGDLGEEELAKMIVAPPDTTPPESPTMMEDSVNWDNYDEMFCEDPQQLIDQITKEQEKSSSVLNIKNKTKRDHTLSEILSSERYYVDALEKLYALFVIPLRMGDTITTQTHEQLFKHLATIRQLNVKFLRQLEECYEPQAIQSIPQLFIKYANYFREYTNYINHYHIKNQLLSDELKTNVEFEEFCGKINQHLKAENARCTSLRGYLVMPVQRIPRYNLLLRDLLKRTPENHPEYKDLLRASNDINALADFINTKKQEKENQSRMLEVEKTYKLKGFASIHRKHEKDGNVVVRNKSCPLMLFNDCMLLVTPKKLHLLHYDDPMLNIRAGDSNNFVIELHRDEIVVDCNSHLIAESWLREINHLKLEYLKNNQSNPQHGVIDDVEEEEGFEEVEIRAGNLLKQGGIRKNWRRRWHVLTNKRMKYFDKKGGKVKGGYAIQPISSIKVGESHKYKMGFFVATSDRVYICKAND
eukprot:CAMPEP_0117428354 /NCGR_PEP_ID=MMETSP0758-20121206/8087_1 /TAXON_ID=63605 /ORGANISM="Percolomonas cosmopolitus, Strain AE-1 (ATCC 50343)" /LENGTH=528 /DNA_ID=CAMNT_0005214677 /DNA_START=175 /DNA_END=1758 /DNA_ORIENTATION=-